MNTQSSKFEIKKAEPGIHGFYATVENGDLNRISLRERSASGNYASHVGYVHPKTNRAVLSNEDLADILTKEMISEIINHFE